MKNPAMILTVYAETILVGPITLKMVVAREKELRDEKIKQG